MEAMFTPLSSVPLSDLLTRITRLRIAVSERLMAWPPWVVVVQIFIGLGWMRAVTEKVISWEWWTGATINDFLFAHRNEAVHVYEPFLQHAVSPHLVTTAVIVVLAQLFAATTLLTGRFVTAGLTVGIFLNLNFLSAGAVNPSAFYLLAQGSVALWLAGRHVHLATVRARLGRTAVASALLGASAVPSIRTIAVADVIDDAAIMLLTAGFLASLACELTLRHHRQANRHERYREVLDVQPQAQQHVQRETVGI